MKFPRKAHLKSEVKNLLFGYYDFERFYVLLNAHKNPVLLPITLLHEVQHQRLNTTTTYGYLVTKIVQTINKCEDEFFLKKLNLLLQRLIENCTIVQEMQATYISLIDLNQKKLFDSLPKSYQKCFNLMESILVNVPQKKQWLSLAAFTLSRIAMFTPPLEGITEEIDQNAINYINKLLDQDIYVPDSRIRVVHDVMQKFEFEQFKKTMKEWGSTEQEIKAYLTYDEENEIRSSLGIEEGEWLDRHNDWGFTVMRSFFEMFEAHLPGIEDARQFVSLRILAKSAVAGAERSFGNNEINYFKKREIILESCNQRVSFHEPGTITADVPKDVSWLTSNMLRTYRLVNCNYILYLCSLEKEELKAECHVLDYILPNQVSHYILSGERSIDSLLVEPFVSIIEIDPKIDYWSKELLQTLNFNTWLGDVFIYYSLNPIKLIEDLLLNGFKIEWCIVVLYYQDDSVTSEDDIHLIFYWIDELQYPIFHISNTLTTTIINDFINNYVINTGQIHQMENSEVTKRLPNEVFSKLFDHPCHGYYLSANTAYEAFTNFHPIK